MKKPSCGFAIEGLPFMGLAVLTTITFAILECWFMALVGLVAAAFIGHFFRDPERVTPSEINVAVSPADGKVCRIGRDIDPISGEERRTVCIFMNVFNVHVNRAPVSGDVMKIKYYPGSFVNAGHDKASHVNERCALAIREKTGSEWTMVQIAGLIARRIICRAEEGDFMERGERMGLIRFGSRVDLYLPEDYSVCVREGEKVVAGQTVVAAKQ